MQITNNVSYSQAHRMFSGAAKQGFLSNPSSLAAKQKMVTPISYADKVTISAAAKELSAKAQQGVVDRPVPSPERPPQSGLKDDYLALKKAQYKYRVAADGLNLAAGNNQGISPSSVHFLANNDEARKQSVTVMEAQSQARLVEHYMTQNSDEDQAKNTAIVSVSTPTLETALLAASAKLLAKYGKEEQVTIHLAKTAA